MSDQDDAGDGTPHGDPEVGSLAEEATRLFAALSDFARDQGGQVGSTVGDSAAGLAGHAARIAHDIDEHVATDAAECRYCPICRTVHAVRGLSPEVKAHLASAASSLAQAAAGVLATVADDPRTREGAGGERRSDHVTRIDLDDGPEADPDPAAGPDGPPGDRG